MLEKFGRIFDDQQLMCAATAGGGGGGSADDDEEKADHQQCIKSMHDALMEMASVVRKKVRSMLAVGGAGSQSLMPYVLICFLFYSPSIQDSDKNY